jgi:hypothetical protein
VTTKNAVSWDIRTQFLLDRRHITSPLQSSARVQDRYSWRALVKAVINFQKTKTNKQTPWPLVRERTIPTDRPPLVDEI